MTPAASTPAVLYLRVSSDKQGESGLGLEGQEAACRRECDRRGWVVQDVITEVQSGAKDVRSGFERAKQLAKESKGVIVAAESSRFSRGTVASVLAMYEQAAKGGYALYALDTPEFDFTSPWGEAMISFFAVINRLSRRETGERVSRALQAKIARGEPVGRPDAISRRDKDPEGAERMVKIVRLLRELRRQGLSYQGIADRLNEQGVTTFSGGTWAKQYVGQTLKRYGEVAA
jgi:DNA invertase Pin-like site-specific DNA recombinase